jgi:Na+/H+ antiporter NhaC
LETTASSSWYYAVIPIAVAVGVTVYFMYTTGRASVLERWAAEGSTAVGSIPLWDVIGNAASSMSLQYGAILGLAAAALMARWGKLLDGRGIVDAIAAGAWVVAPAILILWCASTVSNMTGNSSVDGHKSVTPYQYKDHRLYTGDYLKSVLTGGELAEGEQITTAKPRFSAKLLPTVVFVMAGFVAFATGTSWGTMGILLPMVVTLAHALLSVEGVENILEHPIMVCSVGGVLAGAVFGDHCSPISDTTVLSSQCCGCNHIAHVWTQMPYALLVAVVSIVLGTLPLGYGVPVYVLLPIQLVTLVIALVVLGQKVEES